MAYGRTGPALPAALLSLVTNQLVANAAPFTHARTLPLALLSDLLGDYIQLLATEAKSAAEQAGRHSVAVWDLAHALERFGVASLAELGDEARTAVSRKPGELEGNVGHMANGLKDFLAVDPPPEPIARLCYDVLSLDELTALRQLEAAPRNDEVLSDDSDSETDSHEARTPVDFPPPLPPSSPLGIRIKAENEDDYGPLDFREPIEPLEPPSAWRDLSAIPDYVPSFLPPFPGMEREVDSEQSRKKKRREDELEREVNEQPEEWQAPSATTDPWAAPIAYNSSYLARTEPLSILPTLSPPPSPSSHRKRRRRSLSPSRKTSLISFRAAVAEEQPASAYQPLRPNPKRRAAATAISLSPDNSLANDSLFGAVAVPLMRSAMRTAGFLPDSAGLGEIHPFNTNLPYTIGTPVPSRPTPHPPLMAPPQHPRVPGILASVRAQLAQPTSPHLPLFSRLTRIGPPGPLGHKGEANNYEYVGNTGVLVSNVEWAERSYRGRLPAGKDRGDVEGAGGTGSTSAGGGTGAEGGLPIKLSLRMGQSGSNRGSPAPSATPTPGPWNGSGSPAATPAPSGSWLGQLGGASGGLAGSPRAMSPPVAGGFFEKSSTPALATDGAYNPFEAFGYGATPSNGYTGLEPLPVAATANGDGAENGRAFSPVLPQSDDFGAGTAPADDALQHLPPAPPMEALDPQLYGDMNGKTDGQVDDLNGEHPLNGGDGAEAKFTTGFSAVSEGDSLY